MAKIEWFFYLRRPIIVFFVMLLVSLALVIVGQQYEQAQEEEYQKALSTLAATHSRYRKLVNDIDLLDQYRKLYSNYRSTGLVGKERRLSWIESLESTNQVLRLPTLTYNLQPQEGFERPGFNFQRDVSVLSSPMDLSMGLLHEEDLFALLESLRLSIRNMITVDSCSMNRLSLIDKPLNTKRANLGINCKIRWVTIDAK
jgi:hypothetical protein